MKKINDETTVTLFVNGEQAESAMKRLASEAADLRKELEEAMSSGEKKKVGKLTRELDKVESQLKRVESTAKGTGIVLNDLCNTSMTGLRNALKYLQEELRATRPDTEAWQRYADQINQVKGRIAELNQELEGSESIWGRFKEWADNAWPALDLLRTWAGDFIDTAQSSVDAYASMDQEMANVRKFTGMTEEQVAALNEEFKKMDTRTSREGLNMLAQEAGRLGKSSQEDVLGFVRAADQINVALDELGEGATLEMSKLANIFGDEAIYGTEQSLLKVGSVVNDLSQSCTSSASYIVDFAMRMGGVGKAANMTIPQIMAWASTCDTQGLAVESSATALSQVITRMFTDPEKYAKVAGLEVEQFTKLLREDTNAALIEFMDALNKSGGMNNLAPMFKDMGESGARVITTLSTMADKIGIVKEQQALATQAFIDGTSVTNEYNIQNNTAQATLEKCQKAAYELRVELGQYLYPLMKYMLISTSSIRRAALSLINFAKEHKAAIAALAAAITAYTVVVNLAIIKDKIHNAVRTARIALSKAESVISAKLAVVTEGLRLVYFRLTGQVQKAMVAQRAFSAAMAATPWGAILTAIAAAIAAFKMFDNEVESTTEKYEVLDKAKEDAAVKLSEEKYLLEQNIKKIKEFSGTKEQEKTLISQLNEKYGPILGTYSSLSDWLKTLTTRGSDYCMSIQKQIIMEGRLEQARQLIAKAAKMRNEGDGDWDGFTESWNAWANSATDMKNSIIRLIAEGEWGSPKSPDDFYSLASQEYWARAERQAQELEARALALREEAEADAKAAEAAAKTLDSVTPTAGPITPYVSSTLTDKKRREQEKDARKAAMAKRRELAMAKKEFKKLMSDAKGDYEFGTAQNIMDYGAGLKTYEEFLAEKERLDLAYVDKRIEIYNGLYTEESETDKQLLLMYDEEYQKFLQKRAELTNKFASQEAKRNVDDLKREYGMRVAQEEFNFNSPNSAYYGDSMAQAQRLHELKIEYLTKYKQQYKVDSKEWIEYEQQIQTEEQDFMLHRQKQMMKSYEDWVNQYTTISADRRYEIELGIIEKLYEQRKISEEEYQLWLAQLREKHNSESDAATSAATKSKYTVAGPGGDIDIRSDKAQRQARADKLKAERKRAEDELQLRFENGIINEKELQDGLAKIRKEYEKGILDPVRSMLDEQTRMLFDLGVAWYDFFKSISENGKLSFEDIKDVAAASLATLCAGLQTYSQFVEAEKRIELAAVEKRYDREIKMAQGNSYKVAKAEKKKEDEIAKVKAEYAKKEFAIKVIMAVAQTAQNALLGYAAGLQAGFPMATWLAPLLAGMAVAQGAIQIALLKKQQQAAAAEGYSEGGFTKKGGVNEPAGIVHAGEWVASQKLLANPVARPMIDALDYAQRTNTIGSLRADDVSRSITANNSLVRIAESNEGSALMTAAAAAMASTVADLTDRLREPFYTINTVTGEHGIHRAEDEYSRLLKNKTPKSKR